MRRTATLIAILLPLLMLASCASSSDDSYTRSDGAGGPLTVELANFDVARLGSARDAQYIAQMLFSIANNSSEELTVKKISISQRGMMAIDLQSPAKGFNRSLPPAISDEFMMEAQVRLAGPTSNLTEQIRLAMLVEVLLTNGEAYEYTFDVAVDPSDVGR